MPVKFLISLHNWSWLPYIVTEPIVWQSIRSQYGYKRITSATNRLFHDFSWICFYNLHYLLSLSHFRYIVDYGKQVLSLSIFFCFLISRKEKNTIYNIIPVDECMQHIIIMYVHPCIYRIDLLIKDACTWFAQ